MFAQAQSGGSPRPPLTSVVGAAGVSIVNNGATENPHRPAIAWGIAEAIAISKAAQRGWGVGKEMVKVTFARSILQPTSKK